MSIKLILSANEAEQNNDFHIIRLLILLSSQISLKPIAGITKLVKLDFLLRYPNCLSRALKAIGYKKEIQINEIEKTTIESTMIRFRYGPWDNRYRQWISIMQAKNLVRTYSKGKTVYIELTPKGLSLVQSVKNQELFKNYFSRSAVIMKIFNNYSASGLVKFIYNVFPELVKMKWGEKIIL